MLIVQVTTRDIERSRPGSDELDPVSLALKRINPSQFFNARVRIFGRSCWLTYDTREGEKKSILLDTDTKERLMLFDRTGLLDPFEFSLHV